MSAVVATRVTPKGWRFSAWLPALAAVALAAVEVSGFKDYRPIPELLVPPQRAVAQVIEDEMFADARAEDKLIAQIDEADYIMDSQTNAAPPVYATASENPEIPDTIPQAPVTDSQFTSVDDGSFNKSIPDYKTQSEKKSIKKASKSKKVALKNKKATKKIAKGKKLEQSRKTVINKKNKKPLKTSGPVQPNKTKKKS